MNKILYKILIAFVLLMCSLSVHSQDQSHNYIRTVTYLENGRDSIVGVQYYDGLGRPDQKVVGGANASGIYLHCHTEYDGLGRADLMWLPVKGNQSPGYLSPSNIPSRSAAQYHDGLAYSDVTYDALDRTTFTTTPGAAWAGRGKRCVYRSNDSLEVRRYSAADLRGTTYYPPRCLYCTENWDEDSLRVQTFKDFLDRTILERRGIGEDISETYYVYNDLSSVLAAGLGLIPSRPATPNYRATYDYDKNSNLTGLVRYGRRNDNTFGIIDNLNIAHNGNQLRNISDEVSTSLTYTGSSEFVDGSLGTGIAEYSYNGNGALTKDLNRNITGIEYDLLGNPTQITFTSGRMTSYVYSADGRKLRTTHRQGTRTPETINYNGPFEFRNGYIDRVSFSGGYYDYDHADEEWLCHYYITDYQGSVRMVVNQDAVAGAVPEQVTHYYPYGGVIGDISMNETLQRNKFEGKELDRTFGLDNYDIHARNYFAMAPMWDRPDSKAEDYYGISPYVYCGGDPVNKIDPTGSVMETLWDIANVGLDIYNLASNILKGDLKEASFDAGALLIDAGAAIVPFVPGGAGAGLKAIRTIDKTTDGIKTAEKISDTAKAIDRTTEAEKVSEKIKISINPEDKIDRSLLEAPSKPGNAPTFKSDGTPVEIHHVDQNPNGPFIEMHVKDHRGKGTFKLNHQNNKRLTPKERKDFNRAKKEYWKNEYKKD